MIKIKKLAYDSGPNDRQLLDEMHTHFHRLLAQSEIGFFQIPHDEALYRQSNEAADFLKSLGNHVLFFGIGGSALGPQCLMDLYPHPERQVTLVDNLDPDLFSRSFAQVRDWKQTSFVFVSKSGSTIETLVSLQALAEELTPRDPEWTRRALVITEDKPSALKDWARQNQVKCADVPLNVGGRFSVFSPVGLVIAAYLGVNLEELRQGQIKALQNETGICQLALQTLRSWQDQRWITQFWNYSSLLKSFGAWTVQLWAESLAQATTRQGQPAPRVSTPLAAVGACDQHSVLQQVMEGARDKCVVLLTVAPKASERRLQPAASTRVLTPAFQEFAGFSLREILNIEAQGMVEGMRQQKIPVLEMEISDLSPASVAELMMTWMLVIGTLGSQLQIDPFVQPGVELGKRLAREILRKG